MELSIRGATFELFRQKESLALLLLPCSVPGYCMFCFLNIALFAFIALLHLLLLQKRSSSYENFITHCKVQRHNEI